MTYTKRTIYIPEYEWSSRNQHGDRYKRTSHFPAKATKLTAKMGDVKDMTTILILSDQLDVPVVYDFNTTPQTACIELVAKRNITA